MANGRGETVKRLVNLVAYVWPIEAVDTLFCFERSNCGSTNIHSAV
jgi:hypothetical protein